MPTYSQNPIADATVWDEHPSTNYGTQQYLYIGEHSAGEVAEIFLKWDLSSILSGYTINSAYLKLYQYDSSDDWQNVEISVACECCGASWTESGITWNNKPANLAGTPSSTCTIHNHNTWYQWNVKEHVEAIIAGTNYGFRLRYTGTSSETAKYFRSGEYGTASLRPVLVIDYTDLPNPTEPTINTISTVTTASKTFTFGASTDPIFTSAQLYYEMQISFDNGASYDATVSTSSQGVASCAINIKGADYLNIVAGRYYYNTQCKIRVRAKTPSYGGSIYYSDWVVSSAFTIDYRIAPGAPASLTPSDTTPYEGEAITFTCGRPATYNTHDDDGNVNSLTYYVRLSSGTALANAAAAVTSSTKDVPYTVGDLTTGMNDLSTYINAYCKDTENQTGAACANVAMTIKRFRAPIVNAYVDTRTETTAVVHIVIVDTGYGGVQDSSQINKLQFSLAGAAYADVTLDGAWSGLTNSFTVGNGTNGAALAAGTAYSLGVKVVNNAPADTALSDLTSAAYSATILAYTPGWFADENGSCQKSLLVHSDYTTAVSAGCGVVENNFDIGGDLTAGNIETGTFTPTIGGSTGDGTVSYTLQYGKYVKTVNKVEIWVRIAIDTVTSAPNGNLLIEELPFASVNEANFRAVGSAATSGISWGNGKTHFNSYLSYNSAQLLFVGSLNDGATQIAHGSYIANGDNLYAHISYPIA